jgi:hypothetical protein
MPPPLPSLVVAALSVVAGCRSPSPAAPPDTLAVSALLYADETPSPFVLQSVVTLGETLLPELAFAGDAPFVRAQGADPEACELRVVTVHQGRNGRRPVRSQDLERGAVSGATIAVQVAGELECNGEEGPLIHRASAEAEHPVPESGEAMSPDALREAASRSLRDACLEVLTTLAGLASTSGLRDDEIIALLTAAPSAPQRPGPLAQAALEAGQRQLTQAVAFLRELSAHPHRLVATRAAAALGTLRDEAPETLDALVAMTRGDDPARHLAALHALADIGTESALRYVSAIADSHPSPALREVARARLADTRRKPPR